MLQSEEIQHEDIDTKKFVEAEVRNTLRKISMPAQLLDLKGIEDLYKIKSITSYHQKPRESIEDLTARALLPSVSHMSNPVQTI